jgi:uncharacterized protein (DUF2267 family)
MRTAVEAMINGMEIDVSAGQGVKAQLMLELAGALDRGIGMATAAVSKELRDTMQSIMPSGGDDHDHGPAAELVRLLSAPIRDEAAPRKIDSR